MNKKKLLAFTLVLFLLSGVVVAAIAPLLVYGGVVFLAGVIGGYLGAGYLQDGEIAQMQAEIDDLDYEIAALSLDAYYTYASSTRLFGVSQANDVELALQMIPDARNYVYEVAKYKALSEYNSTGDSVAASVAALSFVDAYYRNLSSYYIEKEEGFLTYIVDMDSRVSDGSYDANFQRLIYEGYYRCFDPQYSGEYSYERTGVLVYNFPATYSHQTAMGDCKINGVNRYVYYLVDNVNLSIVAENKTVADASYIRSTIPTSTSGLSSPTWIAPRTWSDVDALTAGKVDASLSRSVIYDKAVWDSLYTTIDVEHDFVSTNIGAFVDMLLTQASQEQLNQLLYDPSLVLALTRDIGPNGTQSNIMIAAEMALLGMGVPDNLTVSTMTLDINGSLYSGVLAGEFNGSDTIDVNETLPYTGYLIDDAGNIYYWTDTNVTLLSATDVGGNDLLNVTLSRYTADFDSMSQSLQTVLSENADLQRLLEDYLANMPSGGGGGFGDLWNGLIAWMSANKMIAGIGVIGLGILLYALLNGGSKEGIVLIGGKNK